MTTDWAKVAKLDLSPIFRRFPRTVQQRVKAVAATITSLGATAVLILATIDVPTWVPVVVLVVTGLAGPLAVLNTENVPLDYDAQHDIPDVAQD